jgi:hypothetical protein
MKCARLPIWAIPRDQTMKREETLVNRHILSAHVRLGYFFADH